jgi:hypothetical protein
MLWAIESFKETVGQRPQGWYCRYGPSVHTRELLVEEGGFVYDAGAYNDDLPYFTVVQGKCHLVVPYSLTYNDARFVLAQGYGSPSDFRRLAEARLRYLLGRRRRTAPHDVDRAASAANRPGGTHFRAEGFPRLRARQGRRLVREAHRHCALVTRAPRRVQTVAVAARNNSRL